MIEGQGGGLLSSSAETAGPPSPESPQVLPATGTVVAGTAEVVGVTIIRIWIWQPKSKTTWPFGPTATALGYGSPSLVSL